MDETTSGSTPFRLEPLPKMALEHATEYLSAHCLLANRLAKVGMFTVVAAVGCFIGGGAAVVAGQVNGAAIAFTVGVVLSLLAMVLIFLPKPRLLLVSSVFIAIGSGILAIFTIFLFIITEGAPQVVFGALMAIGGFALAGSLWGTYSYVKPHLEHGLDSDTEEALRKLAVVLRDPNTSDLITFQAEHKWAGRLYADGAAFANTGLEMPRTTLVAPRRAIRIQTEEADSRGSVTRVPSLEVGGVEFGNIAMSSDNLARLEAWLPPECIRNVNKDKNESE